MNFVIQTLLFKFIKEAALSMLGQLPWKIITERLLSRLLVAALRKLASMTTNSLDDATVEDVIQVLKRVDLPEVK